MKVKDKASKDKSTNSIAITPDSLRINKTLLIGKKLKKYFAGFGGAIGTVTKYHLDHDAYQFEYSDGHIDIIPFNDVLKLLPKAWSNPQVHFAHIEVNSINEPVDYSPTASYVTIRLVLALTALPGWYGVDLDATGAFISAPLPEEQVYLKGIPGYELPPGKCLRLKKT